MAYLAVQLNLVRTFILSRILVVFAVIPALRQVWNCQTYREVSLNHV